MSIVPRTPAPAYPGRRWATRRYPGDASTCPRFRSDIRADLSTLMGLPREIRDDIELCASEAFAHTVSHPRSRCSGGSVFRMLSTPIVMGRETTLRLSVSGDHLVSRPSRASARCSLESWERAEPGRGLSMIHNLATEWGIRRWTDPTTSDGPITALWAEFTYATRACTCGGLS